MKHLDGCPSQKTQIGKKNQHAMGKNNTPQNPRRDTVGGFAIGDAVEVTNAKSTYHKKSGKISSFCKNGSDDFVYVDLEGDKIRRLATFSLTRKEGPEPVGNSTDSTGVPSTIMKDSVGSTDSSFGRRVLTIFEYVEHMKKEYKHDDELCAKLFEIEKMILGLTLNE